MSIIVKNLKFSYADKKVLDGISFSASEGKLIALIGANGVGKTTLFKCILGRIKNYEGDIIIDGKKTVDMSSKELSNKLSYVPQVKAQTFSFSVFDVVLMGTSHNLSTFKNPGKKEEKICKNAIEEVGISNLINKKFLEISGGEQQLVLIARAIAQQSKIILMDEPTSALDYGNQYKIMKKIKDLSQKGYLIILSTHNPNMALEFADETLALYKGRIEKIGKTYDIVESDLIKKIYNVDVEIIDTGSKKIMYIV